MLALLISYITIGAVLALGMTIERLVCPFYRTVELRSPGYYAAVPLVVAIITVIWPFAIYHDMRLLSLGETQ